MDNNEALVVIVFMLCVTVITVTFIMFGRTKDGRKNEDK